MKVVEAIGIKKYFPIRKGLFLQTAGWVKAVESVDFEISENTTMGVVGESGCGKTTLGNVLAGIHEASGGTLIYRDRQGREHSMLNRPSRASMREYRRNVQMVFQDPYESLDPHMTVSRIIREPLDVHGASENKVETREYIDYLLERVGLYPEYGSRYPHEFSGGQRQRISIARALALKPRLIICDEPTSALDVSVQSQVLNLLNELKSEFQLSYLFISHNLDVVRHMSDTIAVLYLGRVMEQGPSDEVFLNPRHPYTRALLAAVPDWNPHRRKEIITLEGEIPSPVDPPAGCPFQTRCPEVRELCLSELPELKPVSQGVEAACHLVKPDSGIERGTQRAAT